jgi:glutamate-1-semialdehyde 2,1-aminomutase
MDMVAPLGPVYQAGTLSGNPLAMAAGLATVKCLREQREIYPELEAKSAHLVQGVADAARTAGVGMTHNRVGSMFTWFFTSEPVVNWESAKKADTQRFGRFHRVMLEQGIYLPPSQFEAAFLSASHTDADIQKTTDAAAHALRKARA